MNNLKSYTEYAVSTPTTDFVIGFDFNYGTDAVNVTVDGVPATEAGYSVIYLNSTTIRLSPAVPSGVVRLQRETDIDVPDNQFTAGAKFIASNMDENFTQLRHSQQEVRDGFGKLSEDTYEIIDTLQIVGQAAQDAADAAEQAAQTANDAAAQVNDKVSYADLDTAVEVAVTPLKDYVVRPFDAGKSYPLNARVLLDNGDTARSTIAANTTNPNTDQTGWEVGEHGSIHTVGSVTEMLSLSKGFQHRVIQVKSTGAMYQYDPAQSTVDDGVYIRSGWVLIGLHDQLLAGTAGLKGDGTNEYTKLKALFNVASTLKRPVNLCGLAITSTPITTTGDLKLIGSGGIKLLSGSNATLLTSAHNLVIDGDIQLDPDLANNSGGTVGAETHCTIKHTGPDLILKGAKIKPSRSINVVTRATRKVLSQDTEIEGGMFTFYAITPNASVSLIGGEYKNSTLYDNIQILNGGDVVVERVRAKDSTRSNIVISNSTGKARIFGNLCSGAKVDGANQGGWGIVASVNSQDSVICLNVCYNNQRGPITVDTYPDSGPSVDNRIVVAGNICNAMYNNGYGTSGMVLNNAKHANVFGNIIFKAAQGILGVDCDFSTVHGNTLIDCRDYFASFNTSHNISFKDNILDGCPITGAAAIRFIDCNRFYSGGNTIRNLTGAAGFVYRVSGNSKDWTIADDDCIRTVAGSGYVFHILGAGNTGGRIRRNRFKADGVAGWQWYIMSDNLAQFSTHDNEIESTGTNYISSGANVTAGDDTVNGSRNVWASAPTTHKSRIGQVAAIAGALKFWNGSAWA